MGDEVPLEDLIIKTEERISEPEVIDPIELAAMKFTKLLPYVAKLGSAMPSQKGIVRVLHALAEFPLGKDKPRLLNAAERQLFQVLQELQSYKSTVISDIIKKSASTAVPETEVKDGGS